jgi:hypothetical protein
MIFLTQHDTLCHEAIIQSRLILSSQNQVVEKNHFAMKSISELIEQIRETEMKMIALYSEARNQKLQEPKYLPLSNRNS